MSARRFTGDGLRLLAPLITPEIAKMARERVASGQSFFRADKLIVTASRSAVKLALILARVINPHEAFDNSEEGLLRGLNRKTIGKLKTKGEL